jgi:holo-[acyl-carrier protein] synthase
MIYGTGIDIIEIARIRNSLDKYAGRFEEKIFTPVEIAYCRSKADPSAHFAARFAVKEAVLKCLGTGMAGGISWRDLEIVNHETTGKPSIRLAGKGKELFDALGLKTIHVSISHDKTHAVAQAVAEA